MIIHPKGHPLNKKSIQAIIDNEYQVPASADLDDLTTQLIANLSSTDAYVRENSTEVLWQWGMTGKLKENKIINLGEQMTANLAVGLGESGTDTVFLRAFSVLVLAMVVIVDQRYECGQREGRKPFLTQEKVLEWYNQPRFSLEGEKDHRGFVIDAGWAHAVAHMSDALRDFARSRHLDTEQLERLLQAIAAKMTQPSDSVYRFDEDNRIVQTVLDVLLREQVPMSFLSQWLETLACMPEGGHWTDVISMEGCDEGANNARINTRSFLRSLYFQLLIGPRSFRSKIFPEYYARPIPHRQELMNGVVDALKKMDKWFYVRDE